MSTQAMAESSEKVHGVHYSTRILSAELSYNDQILVKDTPAGKEMAFVRSKPKEKMKTSPQPVRRRVFLVSIPFQSYGGIFSGTPMMRRQRQHSPWPLLENNVHIFRYWILCIVNNDSDSPPSRAQLLDADYFDCPQEPLLRGPSSGDRTMMFKLPSGIVETIEAIQELGRTSCSNDIVERERDKLNGLWGSYYTVLWNSQQFGIRLAYLTLQQDFLPTAKTVLRRLLVRLKNSTGDFVAARHFGCMAAFCGFGIATMGAGVLIAWGTAGGSLITHDYKGHTVDARIAVLRAAFPRLADI